MCEIVFENTDNPVADVLQKSAVFSSALSVIFAAVVFVTMDVIQVHSILHE